ncbi:MAG: hypothetical protein LBS27_05430 [Bifidobacteriaceae bacterium]|jgi:hypothetical protein|nr:hypothetical protein [Bifidobacteriaceae bacterium]
MLRRLVALGAGAALLAGGLAACGDDGDTPVNGGGQNTATGDSGGGSEGGSSDVSANTCDDFTPRPALVALWPDALWADVKGDDDCEDEIPGNLMLDLADESRIGNTLRVASRLEQVEPAHQISITNAELGGASGTVVALADGVVTDAAVYSEWLEKRRRDYDGAITEQMTDFDYWEKAFGGPVAFEDMWMDVSRLGETFVIGPTYTPADSTAADVWGRVWYFMLDSDKVPNSLDALKFDLTVDGETKTIAFDLA